MRKIILYSQLVTVIIGGFYFSSGCSMEPAVGKTFSSNIKIPIPKSTNGKYKVGLKISVLVGPSEWNTRNYKGKEKYELVAWQIRAKDKGQIIKKLIYGKAPNGYVTINGPKSLDDGCYSIRVEPCCDSVGEFEVRQGKIITPCQNWSCKKMPLPCGHISAQEFKYRGISQKTWHYMPDGSKKLLGLTRTIWQVMPDGNITVYKYPEPLEQVGPIITKLFARHSKNIETFLAVDWDPWNPEKRYSEHKIRPSSILFKNAQGYTEKMYVRWLKVTSKAVMVSQKRKNRIILLSDGIAAGVIYSYGIFDIDGDGHLDLVTVSDSISYIEGDRISANIYLTHAGAGLYNFHLGKPLELGESADPGNHKEFLGLEPDHWTIRFNSKSIEITLKGITGKARKWIIRLNGDRFKSSHYDFIYK